MCPFTDVLCLCTSVPTDRCVRVAAVCPLTDVYMYQCAYLQMCICTSVPTYKCVHVAVCFWSTEGHECVYAHPLTHVLARLHMCTHVHTNTPCWSTCIHIIMHTYTPHTSTHTHNHTITPNHIIKIQRNNNRRFVFLWRRKDNCTVSNAAVRGIVSRIVSSLLTDPRVSAGLVLKQHNHSGRQMFQNVRHRRPAERGGSDTASSFSRTRRTW